MLSRIKNFSLSDISKGITPDQLSTSVIIEYGIQGRVTSAAFDPVQSLFALGTDRGWIYVYGQPGVSKIYKAVAGSRINHVFFRKGAYLTAVTEYNSVHIYSLEKEDLSLKFNVPGAISALAVDPYLDWIVFGLRSGTFLIFDAEACVISPIRMESPLKTERSFSPTSAILSVAFHPRDASNLLLVYVEGVILYSLSFGNTILSINPSSEPSLKGVKTLAATWHPEGSHIVLAHSNGTISFWDSNEGAFLTIQPLQLADQVEAGRRLTGREYKRILLSWCTDKSFSNNYIYASEVYEDDLNVVSFFHFLKTPPISLTSFKAMGDYYYSPKLVRRAWLKHQERAVSLLPLPKESPYYGGGYDPSALMILYESGQLDVWGFPLDVDAFTPSSYPLTISWISPFATCSIVAEFSKEMWLSMARSTKKSHLAFKGGSPAQHHHRYAAKFNIYCSGHSDGSIRFWDVSGDESSDELGALQVRVSDTLRNKEDISIRHISVGAASGGFVTAVGTSTVLVYRYAGNLQGADFTPSKHELTGDVLILSDIRMANNRKKEEYKPLAVIDRQKGSVTALLYSDVGFVFIGYSDGLFVVFDYNRPRIIYCSFLNRVLGSSKRLSSGTGGSSSESATSIHLSIMENGDEGYSSILLHVGAFSGKVITFQIVPGPRGYDLVYKDNLSWSKHPVIRTFSLDIDGITPATASPQLFSCLGSQRIINGIVIAVSTTSVSVFKSPSSKIAHASVDMEIASAGICYYPSKGSACCVVVSMAGTIFIYSLPRLKLIVSANIERMPYDMAYLRGTHITSSGNIYFRNDTADVSMVNIFKHFASAVEPCQIFDPLIIFPPRPQISTVEWIKGRQYVSIDDLNTLLGGQNRPRSRFSQLKELEEQRLQKQQALADSRSATPNSYSGRERQRPRSPVARQPMFDMSSVTEGLDGMEAAVSEYADGLKSLVDNPKGSLFSAALKKTFS